MIDMLDTLRGMFHLKRHFTQKVVILNLSSTIFPKKYLIAPPLIYVLISIENEAKE